MKTTTAIICLSTRTEQSERLFNHVQTARLARVPTRSLLKYWKAGLIKPCNDCQRYGIYFKEEDIYRIRKAETIRISMETNIASAATMLKLTQEIESLTDKLRFARRL